MSATIEYTVFKGSPKGIVESKAKQPAPTGKQVLVRITHSGICGTDEHHKEADMVLGHEGVGVVEKVGDAVQGIKIGDIVGWGYVHKTCGSCEQCLAGKEQYCPDREWYGDHDHHQGSFGSHAIWLEDFLFKVPAGLAPEDAAPLMCGGATVFGVIAEYNIRSTDRVGVVGVGGLGHLAIQFLNKMGCTVVVFSSSDSKREEAMRLGAKEYYTTKGVEKLDVAEGVEHLIVTTSFLPDWKLYLDVVKPRGTIYPITVSPGDFVFPVFPILLYGRSIQGSVVANRLVHKRMLDFAVQHNIKPMIERFPMTKAGVEDGMKKLAEGKMRYRGVLVAE